MNREAAPDTVTCRYFLSNACRLGDACQFSHERTASRPDNICKFYVAGKCGFGNRCRYDHVRPKRGKDQTPPVPVAKQNQTQSNRRLKLAPNTMPGSSMGYDQTTRGHPSEGPKNGLNVNAAEFVPTFASTPAPEISSYAGAVRGEELVVEEGVDAVLCPYHIMGHCYYGDNCTYLHGEPCDLCMKPLLHPFRPQDNLEHRRECMAAYEQEMEESFAMARSRDQACGICMEVVMEKKELSGRRFGILQNCKHVYCLDCIRKWRVQNKSGSIEKEVVRTCPQCRVASDFVTPSSVWVEDEGEKKEIIDSYKNGMKTKSCKYFKSGKGECPFGNRCFYKHAKPDGTIVEGDSPRTVRRRMLQAARQERRRHPDTFVMWEFMQQHMGDGMWSDPDDDEDDDFWDLDPFHANLFGFDNSWDEFTIGSDDSDGEHPWLLQALREELDFLTFSPHTTSSRSTDPRNQSTSATRDRDHPSNSSSARGGPSGSRHFHSGSFHTLPGDPEDDLANFLELELSSVTRERGDDAAGHPDFSSSSDSWCN